MTDLYNKKILKIVIAQTCQTIGWHSIQTSPMDIMIDILDKYLKELTTLCHNNAELCNRTEPNLNDLALAFRSMDININDIDEYINYVQPITCPIAVPQFPLKKTTNLNFLKPGRKEVLTRPVFVYEYLPPIFSDKEDSEQETTDVKPISESIATDVNENINLQVNENESGDENKANIQSVESSNDISIKNNPDSDTSMNASNLDKIEKENLIENDTSQLHGNSGTEDSKDNIEVQNSKKLLFEKSLADISIQKSSIETPTWPALDIASSTIDSTIRDISSVLMTSSGFISPCRAGKLPDTRPPLLKERKSITPPHQIPEQAKQNILKNAQHVSKSSSTKRNIDSDPQMDMNLALQNLVSGKLPKTQDMNERLKKMKNKILVSAHQPNQLKKSLKQRKRNKLVSKNLVNSVQAHKLLKQQKKMQQNSMKLLDKAHLDKDNLDLQNIDTVKGNIVKLKHIGKSAEAQNKKKEKKSKKLQMKELNLEKMSSKKIQEVLLKQMMQNKDNSELLQEMTMQNRMALITKPQDQMKPSKGMSQKQIDFLQKQLQKSGNSYLNKLDVFKKKSSKQDQGIPDEMKARNQLSSTNPHLIQLPFGTTITSTGNMLNRNIDQQFLNEPESRIIFMKDDDEQQSQQKDQKNVNDQKLSIDRNGNVMATSQANSPLVPQLNDKISQQKLQKKLKRKAKQMLNYMEEQPLNLSCIDPNLGQTNPSLKNFRQKNLEWLSKYVDKDKAQNVKFDMQKFPPGTSVDMQKLNKKERKNKKLKNAGNLNQIDMANRNLQNYSDQQQQLMYAAAATASASNPDSVSSSSDKPITKTLLKMDSTKSQANSGSNLSKAQRKISPPQQSAQQQQQDQQQQNAAIVLNAASQNPFLAAAGIDGIFKQFPYPGFPTGPGLIPQALFGPSGGFIPPGKHLGLSPLPGTTHTQISGNPVFNRFNFPTLPIPSNIGREIHRQQELPINEQQSGKYCNIAPLVPDSVIRNIKRSSSRQSDSDFGNQNNQSIEDNEMINDSMPLEEERVQLIEISDDENKKSDEEEEIDNFSNSDKQSRKSAPQATQSSKNWTGNLINIESPTENELQTEDCSFEESVNTSQTAMSESFRINQRNDQGLIDKQSQSVDGNQIKESSAIIPKVKHRKEHHHQHHHKKDKYKDKISIPSNLANPEIHQKSRKSKKDKKTKSKEKLEKKLREKAEKGIRMMGGEMDETTRKIKLDKLQKKLQKKEKRKAKEQQKELQQKREQQQEAILKLPGNIADTKPAYSDNFVLPNKPNFENLNENVINLQNFTALAEKGRELSPELARISPLVTRPQKLHQQTTKLKGKLPETDLLSRKPQTAIQGSSQAPIIINTPQQPGVLSSESSSSSCSGNTMRGPGRPKGSGNKTLDIRTTPESIRSISADASISQPKKPHEQSDEINVVWICPACGRVDDGTPMIGCDGCDAWYHWVCVGIQVPPDENENWYCRVCIAKKQESHETDKKKKKKNKKNKSLNIKVNLNQSWE